MMSCVCDARLRSTLQGVGRPKNKIPYASPPVRSTVTRSLSKTDAVMPEIRYCYFYGMSYHKTKCICGPKQPLEPLTVTSGPGVLVCVSGFASIHGVWHNMSITHTSSHKRGDTGPQLRPGDTAAHSTSRTNREPLSGLSRFACDMLLVRVGKGDSSLSTNRELTRRKRAVRCRFEATDRRAVGVRRGRAAPCVLCISW
jgi:hypothetical protein